MPMFVRVEIDHDTAGDPAADLVKKRIQGRSREPQ